MKADLSALVLPFLLANTTNPNGRNDLVNPFTDAYNVTASPAPTASQVAFAVPAPLQTNHHHEEHRDRERHDDRDRHDERHGHRETHRPRAGEGRKIHFATKHGQTSSTECPQPPVISCSAQAQSTDSCCVVNPGGVLVHAQFWDLGFGVANSWGIHGLWPDKCNNQFYEKCDSSRAYSGSQIVDALQSSGQQDLLDFMNTYWVSNDDSPSEFWSHEWEEHGTCVSTLEPSCISNYQTAMEVVPYFETVVNLFKQTDTYGALTSAGITPSSDATYALVDLQEAVEKSLGLTPDFVCTNSQLTTVQYYFNAQGPLQDGSFVQSHASRSSSCPEDGIQWLPKTVGNGGDSGN